MLNSIFSTYDRFIMGMSPAYSGFLSLAILLFLLWTLWRFIKGNFVWLAMIIILIPATWPALKSIGRALIAIGEFLLIHIKS